MLLYALGIYNIVGVYQNDFWKKYATKYLLSWILFNPLFIILYFIDLIRFPFPKLNPKTRDKLIKQVGYDSKTSIVSLLVWIASTGTTIGMEIVNSAASTNVINWQKIICFGSKLLSVVMFYVIIVRYVEQLHLACQINKDSFKLTKILSFIPFLNSFAWIKSKNIKENIDNLNNLLDNKKTNLNNDDLVQTIVVNKDKQKEKQV